MECCASRPRPSPETHPNATRLERGVPAVDFWEVHLDGCTVHQRWGTLSVEHAFKNMNPKEQHRASRNERPRCKRTNRSTREEAEALRASLVAMKKKQLFVEKPVVVPCPLPLWLLHAVVQAVSLTAPALLLAGWKKENVPPEDRFLNACAPGILLLSFEQESNALQQLRLADAPALEPPEPEPEPESQARGVW